MLTTCVGRKHIHISKALLIDPSATPCIHACVDTEVPKTMRPHWEALKFVCTLCLQYQAPLLFRGNTEAQEEVNMRVTGRHQRCKHRCARAPRHAGHGRLPLGK